MNLKALAESQIPPSWKTVLRGQMEGAAFEKLADFLNNEVIEGHSIHPENGNIFSSFRLTDYDRVKVVLIGQDPYHGDSQAIGLSFAVPNSLRKKPPSLRNLFKELQTDLNCNLSGEQSDLTGWADQGVLLLNTLLTVRRGEPLSHADSGWTEFTTAVLDALNRREKGIVFLLLGGHAGKLRSRIDPSRHRIIEAPHPSPLSAYRGFFGSRIYSRTNEALRDLGLDPIDWGKISLK